MKENHATGASCNIAKGRPRRSCHSSRRRWRNSNAPLSLSEVHRRKKDGADLLRQMQTTACSRI